MSIESVRAKAVELGLPGGDAETLIRHGVTEGLMEKAQGRGLDLKAIFLLTMQFGPQYVGMLSATLDAMKATAEGHGKARATEGRNGGGDKVPVDTKSEGGAPDAKK